MNDFTFSQFIFAIGTLLLTYKIVRNRGSINDFDPSGSFFTLLAMTFVLKAFLSYGDWIGFIAGTMQWIFWLLALSFSLRNWIRNRGKKTGEGNCK